MQQLNIQEIRASVDQLDKLVAEFGELTVTRNGKPIARILPVHSNWKRPTHKNLRARTPPLSSSETSIRRERNER